MKIPPTLMSQCVKDFKDQGTVTWLYLMRKYKISLDMAKVICEAIELRFPKLWENRKTNFIAKTCK